MASVREKHNSTRRARYHYHLERVRLARRYITAKVYFFSRSMQPLFDGCVQLVKQLFFDGWKRFSLAVHGDKETAKKPKDERYFQRYSNHTNVEMRRNWHRLSKITLWFIRLLMKNHRSLSYLAIFSCYMSEMQPRQIMNFILFFIYVTMEKQMCGNK